MELIGTPTPSSDERLKLLMQLGNNMEKADIPQTTGFIVNNEGKVLNYYLSIDDEPVLLTKGEKLRTPTKK